MTTDANNNLVHCDGLVGPNNTDGSDVDDFYSTGEMVNMTASSSGTEAIFTWEDETWAEHYYRITFYWWDSTDQEWVSFTTRSRYGDVGVRLTASDCSSSAACEDRTLTETVDRKVYDTPATWYIMCGRPYFEKYDAYGTWRCSPLVFVN